MAIPFSVRNTGFAFRPITQTSLPTARPGFCICGEIFAQLNGEGKLFAQGDSTSAISAESISVGDKCNYLITAGTSSKDAAEVDRYTGQQYVSYKVRTKTLTLHGSGGTADGKDSISVDTKDSYIDLCQCSVIFCLFFLLQYMHHGSIAVRIAPYCMSS